MKFRGFRASLNFASFKHENSENVSPVSVTGAYTLKNEEFYGLGSYPEPRRKLSPSMVKLPQAFQPDPTDVNVIKASQSTPDLVQSKNLPPNLAKSTPNVSSDPRGSTTRNPQSTDVRPPNVVNAKAQSIDQKKLEKKRLAEQKKREKLEAQERAKEEKLRKQREKLALQEQAKAEKLRKEEAQRQAKLAKKKPAPTANARNPLARSAAAPAPAPAPAPTTNPAGYSTNTLDSSISKSSGPPPYTDQPLEASNTTMMQNENDDTGNTSFGKPIESDNTWDMINQHRQQIARVPVSAGAKQASGTKQGLRFKLTDDKNESSDNNNDAVTGRKSLYV